MNQGLAFLQYLLDDATQHRGYSALGTARSALSAIIVLPNGQKFGDHPNVKLFMKGIFNLKPPQPRYVKIWDCDQVLKLLETWAPAQKLTLKRLSMKLAMLILLVSGQRGQVLRGLRVDHMDISDTAITFQLKNSDLKQGRPGYKPQLQNFTKFENKKLCVYHYISSYLKRTLTVRGSIKQLFLTTVKPYKAASRDTLTKWIKMVLEAAGIDISIFKAGSTRSAANSKAAQKGASMEEILQAGGWSNQSTFTKWYNRPIKRSRSSNLGKYILGNSK